MVLFISKVTALLVLLFGMSAERALACAVCGFTDDATVNAFLLTTLILTCIPLLMIGAVIYYIHQRHKKNEAQHH